MEAPDDIGYEILRSIRRILRKVSQHSRHLGREAGLTVPQLLCLRAIANLDGATGEATVAAVGRRVQLSPATTSKILDRLEQSGLVVRERRSADRRKVCLALTPEGRTRLGSLPTPLQEQFLERIRTLPEPERRRLLESLDRIVEMMEASDLDASPLLAPDADVKKPD